MAFLKRFNSNYYKLTFHPIVDEINDISYFDYDYLEYNECFKTYMYKPKKSISEEDIEFGLCYGIGRVDTYYAVKIVVNQFCMFDFMREIFLMDKISDKKYKKGCNRKKCNHHHFSEYSNCSILGYFTCNTDHDKPVGLLLKIDDKLIFNFNIDSPFMFDVDSLYNALLDQIDDDYTSIQLDSLVRHNFSIGVNDSDPVFSFWVPQQFFIEDEEFSISESFTQYEDEDDDSDDSDDSDCEYDNFASDTQDKTQY